jgi:hypothetical protein
MIPESSRAPGDAQSEHRPQVSTSFDNAGREVPLWNYRCSPRFYQGYREELSMDEFTDTFIKALERLEAENDVELIAGLFSENATLSNPKGTQDSAAAFWTTYRKSFDEVRSSFSNVNQSEGVTFLEWTSEAIFVRRGERVRG